MRADARWTLATTCNGVPATRTIGRRRSHRATIQARHSANHTVTCSPVRPRLPPPCPTFLHLRRVRRLHLLALTNKAKQLQYSFVERGVARRRSARTAGGRQRSGSRDPARNGPYHVVMVMSNPDGKSCGSRTQDAIQTSELLLAEGALYLIRRFSQSCACGAFTRSRHSWQVGDVYEL